MPPQPKPGRPRVFTIAASVPFSAALAKGLLARIAPDATALSDITIYLPTRRAARGIAEIFARQAGGAVLLPDFRPLGDVDEDELLLEGDVEALDLPPAIAPFRQRLLLAAMIRRWSHARDGGTMTFGQAVTLARSLASVMDEVERQGADLGKLDDLAPASLAAHWAEVKEFLSLIHTAWPPLLQAEGCINPGDHRNRAIGALAKRLADNPPDRPIVAAGSTGSIPATADLLSVIARLPNGYVVLPGLDRALDADSWDRLEPNHPQYTLKQLLTRMDVRRDEVLDWTEDTGLPQRERLLREVLRPAPTTDAWRALAESTTPPKAEDLSLFEAADPAEEAAVVALMLREALETPERRAALVTRDRGLARRVTAELKRWAIDIDDSAGRSLPRTPAGSLLCLIAEAADETFAPVPLLALTKHPLVTMGDDSFRLQARRLDRALRGPRPDAGLNGIARALSDRPAALQEWFAKLSAVLQPLEDVLAEPEAPLKDILKAHVTAAIALAPSLWENTDGAAANEFLKRLKDAADESLPDIETGSFAPLLREMMSEVSVRPNYGRHPRLSILGPLEARLQSFDLVILGGLNEGVWPAAASDDPWFSRPMRATLGLEQPERAIGQSAHDFATLAASPRVVLTRAQKSEGTPMVASRWIQRLQQLLRGLGSSDNLDLPPAYREIARAMADPGSPAPEPQPRPTPPVETRPREMSVTDFEKWVRDPYAIYAKRILRLKKLDPIDAAIDHLERGSALHAVLERFVDRYAHLPPDADAKAGAIIDEVFAELNLPRALIAQWRPRFLNAAQWFIEVERERRPLILKTETEVAGEITVVGDGGPFRLYGIADRIDILRAGGGEIIDYKTGAPPSETQVVAHMKPQLSLEGAILQAGGFKDVPAMAPAALTYMRISGTTEPGKVKTIKSDAAQLATAALEKLVKRVRDFDEPDQPYLSRTAPEHVDSEGDYDHLARVKEWSSSGWGSDSGETE